MPRPTARVLGPGFLLLALAAARSPGPGDWPRFRGPDGKAHSEDRSVPTSWDASSVAWKVPLKGRGQSSPVIWGDRIFLTTALEEGRQRVVFCLDRRDGKLLWEQIAWTGTPEPTHEMNGWASATCCTDGERVYASFGKAGLHCYTVEGKPVWSQQLGEFQSGNKRGTAASPVLAGDVVVLNGDSESDPFLFGLDKLTGKVVWKTDRPAKEGYSTPVVATFDGHPQLVLNGDPYVAGYDPATGKRLWWCKSFAGRGEPMPALGDGVVYVVNGLPGDFYAVKLGGEGDVTKSHLLWHTPRRNGRDGPSPLLVGDNLLVCNMQGIASAYDRATGKELWKHRLGAGQITASPTAIHGNAYFVFENGEAVVIQPGKEMKEVSRNTIAPADGELFRASPVPSHGQLFVRSDRMLYCIGKAAKE